MATAGASSIPIEGASQSELRLENEFAVPGDPFAAAVRATRMSMLITDPSQDDNPIIFANRAFSELTGYSHDEIVGRNCRFLQGPETNPASRTQLRECIQREQDLHIEILNYRKDGSTFWNSLYVSPVRDASGEVVYYFASQLDVTDRKIENERTLRLAEELALAKLHLEAEVEERTQQLLSTLEARTRLLDELDHRVKNNLQLMMSLVNLEKRQRVAESERQALEVISARLQALGLVHRRLYDHGVLGDFALADFVDQVAHELHAQSGRKDIRLELDLEDVTVAPDKAGALALLINELISAGIRFGYQGRGGLLRLSLRGREPDLLEFSLSDQQYSPLEKETARASIGAIANSLARQLDASLDWKDGDQRVLATVTLPRTAEIPDAKLGE